MPNCVIKELSITLQHEQSFSEIHIEYLLAKAVFVQQYSPNIYLCSEFWYSLTQGVGTAEDEGVWRNFRGVYSFPANEN